ncbi:potassium channel subfamily K member 2 isoform X2 [Boleophthalmus pectinirostris]|uniref:potassium channel subfamily K member 2 isoform X2 n=1 Tax=Boleophthalmus pectinirostris TaxID=150288 RepID=UPI000A1C544A|nr:potassium channel subfamily K member 2 isoform X2 [Boleophthalmus pectinirostris]
MRCTTLLALLVGVMIYVGLGALVFSTLEKPQEKKAYDKLLTFRATILENSCLSELKFNNLVAEVVSAVEAGLDANSLSANFSTRWDIASAFFFCGTIITTIGFGNLSPRTWPGQLFCVCYALVGIPMFGILLAGVSDHMGTVLRRAVAKIETLFLKRKVQQTTVRVISAILSILIGCLIFLAVPTVVFHKVEKWSFVESLYFVVITLTTVGFGDFVPGGRERGMFKLLVLLWIVFGLAYFASILTMIGNWLRVLSKRTRAEMEELRAHATDWTQNIQNMSMDFRIPNPLEFNDPFLLQRRKWKRSERRHIRRGAQCTVGYLVRGGSENGHLPNRWAGLSASMMELERGSRDRQRVSIAAAGPVVQSRSGPQMLTRSMSLPAARSVCELQSARLESQEGSASEWETFGSGSESSSFNALQKLQSCFTENRADREVKTEPDFKTHHEKDKLSVTENFTIVTEDGHKYISKITPSGSLKPLPLHLIPPLPSINVAGCKLLDYFGENLAFIDESSDTLSDRTLPTSFEEKRRRPRKPRRKSSKRSVSRMRKLSRERLPEKQPTPSPDSSHSESQSDTTTKL